MRTPVFRRWVEVKNLQNGATRTLPLKVFVKIHLVTRKHEQQMPKRQVLRVEDGGDVLEAESLDGLSRLLREKYPPEHYERTLHEERDREAEDRREWAMTELMNLLARAAFNQAIREYESKNED